jgi:flagellar motility protein MotE (MotC chaperone)
VQLVLLICNHDYKILDHYNHFSCDNAADMAADVAADMAADVAADMAADVAADVAADMAADMAADVAEATAVYNFFHRNESNFYPFLIHYII